MTQEFYANPGAHQMEPPSPLISWVNPFPSRFINRTACFPRKVSYFRESRMSPWKKWSWMKSNSEARPSTVFLFLFDELLTWQKIYEIVPVCFCPEMPYTGDVKRGKSEYVDGLLAGVATSMSSELFENWVLFQILPHSTWKEWKRILHICRHLIWKNILKVLIFPSLALIDSFLYHISLSLSLATFSRCELACEK